MYDVRTAAIYDPVAWMSVSLSLCKNGGTVRGPVCGENFWEPKEPCIIWGSSF